VDVCTIIAANYAPFARVLAESLREHHPEATCHVLVIDDHDGRLDPAREPFELVTPAELDIEHFERMAALYDVLELSTAVKPWLLRHLLNVRGCQTLAYLDPDIQLFDRLDELEALLHEHRLVVTPHLTAPMPRDGRKPSETDILIAGTYNLGFIGLAPGPDTDALLDWWGERLETDCVVAPERGFFVDQRWIDFAPGLVPSFHVLRDPGYNVAYWNLPSRQVRRRGEGWEVNGRPLRFFHFSGFDPRRPQQLSKHQDRIRLSREPAVRELCERYAQRLLGHGFEAAVGWPYGYARLPDGTPLDPAIRRAFRHAVEAGALKRGPFSPRGAEELLRWLQASPNGGGPNRYLLALRETRPDLQAAFPQVPGPDSERLTAWAQSLGPAQLGVPAALVAGAQSRNGHGPAAPALGVNVTGYFQSVLGVGEAARQVVDALEAAEVPVSTVGLVAGRSRQEEELGRARGARQRHPINLLCVNADVLPAFADEMGPEFFAGRHSIGLWWWEVSTFPERWLSSFDHVDEVWVGSRHIADALAPVSPVPVVPIVQPVVVGDPAPMSRQALGLPEGFLFLFSFDYNSVFERKNPLAVVDAFAAAFPPGSGAGAALVLKTINHEHDPDNHALLRAAVDAHPDVHLVDRYVSRAERDAMVAACDCYVSLHRSEGFGFTLAEAMALGRPVIGTAYSGTLEFMTAANSYLVDYDLVPIGPGADPYPPEGEWAEPDVAHAARLMREVVEHPEEARRRGERGREDIRARHSHQAAGRVMAERLGRITAGFAARPRAAAAPGAIDLEGLRKRIAGGPPAPPRYRFGAPQRFARRLLLRALKPYTHHARSVDAELARGLESLERTLRPLTVATAAADARIDDLAGQVDALRADAERAAAFAASFGLGDAAAADALEKGGWPEAPEVPWTPEYVERHARFVTRTLDDPALLTAFRRGRALPAGYGVGFDERVVEFPWTVTRDLTGRLLDAGSTLNHPHVLPRVRPRVDELHIVTLAPEPQAYPFLDVSYVYGDLRDLPIRDDTYDRIVSISTLEHVGMDNSQYGDGASASVEAALDLRAAVGELRRVLRPGGTIFVTVPYGVAADLGWQQVFDAGGLEELVEAFGPVEQRREFFRYDEHGWRRARAEECADAVYRDPFKDPPAPDRAVNARAIACLELRLG
jgi:SAM-dependent methyltransferase